MVPETSSLDISRRQFLTAGSLTAAAVCLVPHTWSPRQADSLKVRSRKPQPQKSRFKTFAAISVSFWALAEISPFLLVLTESCWLMRKSSPPVRTF